MSALKITGNTFPDEHYNQMKHTHIKSVAVLLCIILLVFFFFSILTRIFVRNVLIEKMNINNAATEFILYGEKTEQNTSTDGAVQEKNRVNINWETEYPFRENDNELRESKNTSLTEAFVSHIKEFLGLYTEDYLVGYDKMVKADNAVEDQFQWNIDLLSDYNPLVELEGGYFVSYVMPFDVSENIEAVSELGSYCQSNGMDFLYIQTPGKISKYDDTDICGVLDFSNTLADDMVTGLKNNCIDTLDLRDNLHESGMKHRDCFFKTDHHWKPETGLWATGCIAEALNKNYHYGIDTILFHSDRYDSKVYESWFLGSSGKKVTLSKAEPEDITLFYPKFETELEFSIPSLGIEKSGDFSITYDMSCIEEKDYMHKDPYGTYCYSDEALIRIKNNRNTDGKKIVLVKCSYANVVSPFLALGLSEIDLIDLRYFKGSLKRFIETEKPDGVMILYSPDFIGDVEHITRMNPFDFD